MKNTLKPLFNVISSSTKVIEFDNVKFHKSISSKDGVLKKMSTSKK